MNRLPKSSDNAATASTSYHTEPGVCIASAHDLDDIRRAYNEVLGPLNYTKAQMIEQALKNHVQPSAIIDAIQQTAMAPRPSPYYLAAILTRYANDGITTAEAAQADRYERRLKRIDARHAAWSAWYGGPEDDFPF